MKDSMKILVVASVLLGVAAFVSCNWGLKDLEGDAEEEPDVTTDIDGETDAEDRGPEGETPDVPHDPDMEVPPETESPGDPDAPQDPDGAEELEEDAAEEPEPEIGPVCGNGTVETGEACDHTSDFCDPATCRLVAPAGWFECTDGAGNTVFFFLEDWTGLHTYEAFRDHCAAMIEAMTPEDYEHYGLVVITDEAVWDCIEPRLSDWASYYIGLAQDPSGTEPDGGWNWTAKDGAAWVSVAPFDAANGYLASEIDGTGGVGEADCGRLDHDLVLGWRFMDYACEAAMDWDGICSIVF